MVKYIKSKELSRRELRQLARQQQQSMKFDERPLTQSLPASASTSLGSPRKVRSTRLLPRSKNVGGLHKPITVSNWPSPKKRSSPNLDSSDSGEQMAISCSENDKLAFIWTLRDRLVDHADELRDDNERLDVLRDPTVEPAVPHRTPDYKRRQKLLRRKVVATILQWSPPSSPTAVRTQPAANPETRESAKLVVLDSRDTVSRSSQSVHRTLGTALTRSASTSVAKIVPRGSRPVRSSHSLSSETQDDANNHESRRLALISALGRDCCERPPVPETVSLRVLYEETRAAHETGGTTVETMSVPLLLPARSVDSTTLVSGPTSITTGLSRGPPYSSEVTNTAKHFLVAPQMPGCRATSRICKSLPGTEVTSRTSGQSAANRTTCTPLLTPAAVRRTTARATMEATPVAKSAITGSTASHRDHSVRKVLPPMVFSGAGQTDALSQTNRRLGSRTGFHLKDNSMYGTPSHVHRGRPDMRADTKSLSPTRRPCMSVTRSSILVSSPGRPSVGRSQSARDSLSTPIRSNGVRSAASKDVKQNSLATRNRATADQEATTSRRTSKLLPHMKNGSFRPVLPTASLVLLGACVSLVNPGVRLRAVTTMRNKVLQAPPLGCPSAPRDVRANAETGFCICTPTSGPSFIPIPPLATRACRRSMLQSLRLLDCDLSAPCPMLRPEMYFGRLQLANLADSLVDRWCMDIDVRLDTIGDAMLRNEVDSWVHYGLGWLLSLTTLKACTRVVSEYVVASWRLASKWIAGSR